VTAFPGVEQPASASAVPGSSRLSGPLIGLLEAEDLPPAAQILAVGARAGSLAVELRTLGHRVVELPSGWAGGGAGQDPGPLPESFDCVVAAGLLERVPWDRWELQRIHRMLKPDGRLLLLAPNLYSPLSLIDPRYVLAKLGKQVPRLMSLVGRTVAAPAPRAGDRSYPAGRLRAMLEELGFDIRHLSRIGPLSRGALSGSGTWLPTHHLVIARRKPSLFGLRPDRPFPDPDAHRRRFEQANHAFLELRAEWLRAHPTSYGAARPMDPGRYRGTRVLVLSPHPDDEIIGCGGTLLCLARAGAQITVLHATDGSASAAFVDEPPEVRRTVRLDEAGAVARAAGFHRTIFWREDNHAFTFRPELVDRLRATLDELEPSLIFTPFLTDIHADHLTLNRVLAGALEGGRGSGAEVLAYEVWGLAPAAVYCDVTGVMPEVERLLLLYETAMKVEDYVQMCAARNYYHSLRLAGRPGFCEAFFSADLDGFRQLVEGGARADRSGGPGDAPVRRLPATGPARAGG